VAGRRRGWLMTVTRGCGEGPVRRGGQKREMPGKRSVWVSKKGRGAAAEHALRPGEALRARAGAVNTGGGVTWRGAERASAGRGSGGADAGAARGARKGGAGAAGAQHMAGEGDEAAQRRNRGGGSWR
jgi:hypothetical protein